jgi:hypothetical protein
MEGRLRSPLCFFRRFYMTWKELKDNVMNLGFDEDAPSLDSTDIEDIMIVSANRAINLIQKMLVERYETYFKEKLKDEGWELEELTPITSTTKDTFEIEIPEKVIDLVPLLTAHYVWLDDDIAKATMYYNEYDQFRERIEEDISRNVNVEFHGGLGW